MPFKLIYDEKTGKIIAEAWLDENQVIEAEEIAKFRQQYSIEQELQLLRTALIKTAKEELPKEYLDAVETVAENIQARKAVKEEYSGKKISLSVNNWKTADLEKLKTYFEFIGLKSVSSVATLDDLKNRVATALQGIEKYGTE